MKFKELEKKFRKMRSEMPAGIEHISGEYLPDLPLCSNVIRLAGRSIALSGCGTSKTTPEYEAARNALRDILHNQLLDLRDKFDVPCETQEKRAAIREQFHQEAYQKFAESLKAAYINVMREEAKMGCVRVPVRYQSMDETAYVPSKYGDWKVYYAPILTEAFLTEPKAIEATAEIFTKAYLMEEPCAAITIQFKRAMRDIDYFKAQSVLGEFFHTINDYLADEFEEKKNDEKYRYRKDWDPETF